MVDGPAAGLTLLADLEADPRMATSRRFHAVRAHLLEQSGDRPAALAAYERAADHTTNTMQQRYLQQRIKRLRTG
jgi:predicted RNA polymerase sigma factor